MRTPKGLTDCLFIVGLIAPTAYLAISPGTYFTTWYQVLASTPTGGVTMLILFAGLMKVGMYLSGHVGRNRWFPRKFGDAFFGFHVAVDVFVLLAMFWVGIFQGQRDIAVKAFYALFATEFMVFPIIGVSFLQDAIRNRKQNLANVLLASVVVYLCVAFLAVSNLITLDQSVLDLSKLSPLEAVGARVFTILIFLVNLARTSLFWQSSSLYSVDIVAPPIWVSSIYILTVAFYVYYDAHREFGQEPKIGSSIPYVQIPLDIVKASKTILVAVVLAFASVTVADFLLPHNISGDVFQLLVVSTVLLASFRVMDRKARGL